MQPGTPRFSGGEITSRTNIDTFGRYLIIFGRFFRGMSLRANSDPGGANFYIFVSTLGLPKTTARVGSSSSTAEKKLFDVHGVRSLIVYSSSKHCQGRISDTQKGKGMLLEYTGASLVRDANRNG